MSTPLPHPTGAPAPDAASLEAFRPALTGHCYRMLGSVLDAEDAVQDTMLRAWRGRAGFRAQSSVRTWLTRIAAHVCLDALEATRRRRVRPVDAGDAGDAGDAPTEVPDDFGPADLARYERPREHWVEPVPDARVLPAADACDPAERLVLQESIRLACGAAVSAAAPTRRAAPHAGARLLGGRGGGDARDERGGGEQRGTGGSRR